jgi:hypothetical protein
MSDITQESQTDPRSLAIDAQLRERLPDATSIMMSFDSEAAVVSITFDNGLSFGAGAHLEGQTVEIVVTCTSAKEQFYTIPTLMRAMGFDTPHMGCGAHDPPETVLSGALSTRIDADYTCFFHPASTTAKGVTTFARAEINGRSALAALLKFIDLRIPDDGPL